MNITKEAIEAFYSKAEVTRHGTILHLEDALTAAIEAMYAAMPAGVGVETKASDMRVAVEQMADAYVAEQGIEYSGGIVERAFEAGALWAAEQTVSPYGYVFGGCTFLHSGSPLVTDYVMSRSIPVFLGPAAKEGQNND